jgi:hypothetical protein
LIEYLLAAAARLPDLCHTAWLPPWGSTRRRPMRHLPRAAAARPLDPRYARMSPWGALLRPTSRPTPPDAAQARATSSVRSNLNMRGERKEKEE